MSDGGCGQCCERLAKLEQSEAERVEHDKHVRQELKDIKSALDWIIEAMKQDETEPT